MLHLGLPVLCRVQTWPIKTGASVHACVGIHACVQISEKQYFCD